MPASDMTPLGGEPPTATGFLLEVDGVRIGLFRSVHGLELTVQAEEYSEGGVNGYTHRFPGRMSWPNLVLSRGLTDSDALFTWINKAAGDGFEEAGQKMTRSTAAVTILSQSGERLRAYDLEGAFPVRWAGPRMSVSENAPLTEELEITHTGFRARNLA